MERDIFGGEGPKKEGTRGGIATSSKHHLALDDALIPLGNHSLKPTQLPRRMLI